VSGTAFDGENNIVADKCEINNQSCFKKDNVKEKLHKILVPLILISVSLALIIIAFIVIIVDYFFAFHYNPYIYDKNLQKQIKSLSMKLDASIYFRI
jgi:hypothetical protein